MNYEENRLYWENYVSYWEDKVDEANDEENVNRDKAPNDNTASQYLEKLNLQINDKILDYGCGSCRIYPYIRSKMGGTFLNYYGIDIAESPLDIAVKKFPELKNYLKILDKNNIPYEKNTFDKIFCFGVFDACPQEITLDEIIRVLKVGGKAFITGKNINYCLDDKEALTAEINARKKGHPNSFTDLELMCEQLKKRKVNICELGLFQYRGDLGRLKKGEEALQKPFYEFYILIEKTKETKREAFEVFSNSFSKTYLKVNED